MSKHLYGANGSEYVKVKYIPHGDSGSISYFNGDGNFYRNLGNTTYKMTKKGGDNWAGRQRAMVNVELQRRRFRK